MKCDRCRMLALKVQRAEDEVRRCAGMASRIDDRTSKRARFVFADLRRAQADLLFARAGWDDHAAECQFVEVSA